MSTCRPYCMSLPADGAEVPGPDEAGGRALFRQIEAMAEASPESLATDDLTYGQLLDASLTLAGYMQQRLGVRAGDAVLLLVPDRELSAIAACAIARCDARAVVPDPAGERLPALAAAGAQVAIAAAEALPALVPLLDDGSLYGCIVCGGAVSARPGVHDFAGALSAGIAPVPLPVSARCGRQGVVV